MAVDELREELTLRYDGPGLDAGTMDVRELAPSLLALSSLFQRANRLTNPTVPDPALRLRATGRGSFTADLMLYVDSLQSVLVSDPAIALIALKDLIIDPTTGLIAYLIRKHRSRDQDAPEELLDNGDAQIELADGTTITYPAAVMVLAASTSVRGELELVLAPLATDECDEVVFQSPTTPSLSVTTDDLPAFAPELTSQQPAHISESDTLLEIVSPAFDGRKWRVRDGSGTYWVTILDDIFNQGIDRGLIRFGKGDLLLCRVRSTQYATPTGLHAENEVVQVLHHTPAEPDPSLGV